MNPTSLLHPALAFVLVCLAVTPAAAQYPTGRGTTNTQLQQPLKAPVTLTPSVTFSEEYNDNVLLNNNQRRWDLITGIIPGVTFSAQQPTWHVNAAYDFQSRLYARDSNRNAAFDRQNFSLDSAYDFTPTFGVALTDGFAYDTGINAFSPQGVVVTGRDRMWSNRLRPSASFRVDPLTTVRGGAGWDVQRFQRAGLLNSDIWEVDADVERVITPRLRGLLGYTYAVFDIQSLPQITAHSPRVGLTYDFTPTITGTVAGGPTLVQFRGIADHITPAVAANLTQRHEWGSATVFYDRAVSTAGGLGGSTDNQDVGVSIAVTTLMRGLTIEASPRYRTFNADNALIGRIDVKQFAIPLQATYQITPWLAFTAGYSFFQQRSHNADLRITTGTSLNNDIDQNRVFFGLSVGYPIRFD